MKFNKNNKNKKAQEEKSKILAVMPKKAQEEMVGFGLIIIIVAVILLIFLSISLKKPEKDVIESYEINSFLGSVLQYNTECRDVSDMRYLSIKDLIFECYKGGKCLDEKNTCDVLNFTLIDILNKTWKTEEEYPYRGYNLNITNEDMEIVSITKGNITNNYKSGLQYFTISGNSIDIIFRIYSEI